MDILLLHKKLFWTDREDLKCMLLLFQQSLFVSYCVNFLPAEYVYRSGHKGVCVCVCVCEWTPSTSWQTVVSLHQLTGSASCSQKNPEQGQRVVLF